MIDTADFVEVVHRGASAPGRVASTLRLALGWPFRVAKARRLLLALARLEDHELRDIGLRRADLREIDALAFDADPSAMLRRRVDERRRRR